MKEANNTAAESEEKGTELHTSPSVLSSSCLCSYLLRNAETVYIYQEHNLSGLT